MSDAQWASTVAARRRDLIGALAETVLARGLSPLGRTAIDLALTATVSENAVPILPMVVDHILNPGHDDGRLADDGRLVGHALHRLVAGDLAGLFDGPSTVRFDPSLPVISLDLSRVTENSTLISVLMTCSPAWTESALLDPDGGQRWVIYDEAWRLMPHPASLRRMDAHWRLARHYWIASMLIFHKLADLDNVGDQGSAMRSLANNCCRTWAWGRACGKSRPGASSPNTNCTPPNSPCSTPAAEQPETTDEPPPPAPTPPDRRARRPGRGRLLRCH